MDRSRFSEEQIIAILKRQESGPTPPITPPGARAPAGAMRAR